MSLIELEKHDFSDVRSDWAFTTLSKLYGPDLAAEQLALEHEAHVLGEQRFEKVLARQVERGEFSENIVAKPLVAHLLPLMIEKYNEWVEHQTTKVRRKSTALKFLLQVKPANACAITIKAVLNCLSKNKVILQDVAVNIGDRIEEEARFGRIRDEEAAHFNKHIRTALGKRNGLTYKKAFMEAVEAKMLTAGELKGKWSNWDGTERAVLFTIGFELLSILKQSTNLIELVAVGNGKDKEQQVRIMDQWQAKLSQRAFDLSGITPYYQPCVVPPRPWIQPTGGGYWGRGRRPCRFIRVRSKRALERYRDVHMPDVYKAVNIAQNSAWRINDKVLEVAEQLLSWKHVPIDKYPTAEPQELPPRPEDIDTNPEALAAWKKAAAAVYRTESARVSRRFSMEMNLETARKFSGYEAIYFPYNLDWRGRVYALPGLNPQGNDMTKGLLQAAQAEPVGEEGIQWLMIHGANTAGIDKVPFDERKQWVRDNSEMIYACAEDPLNNTDWMHMDSPFCFLAFCFEWIGVRDNGPLHASALPLAFDGSCSGIQHFSAMLQDERGGRAVNLLPSESVQDIYRLVADEVIIRVESDMENGTECTSEVVADEETGELKERRILGTRQLAINWFNHGITRGTTKRPVMTLAYGSKKYGFTDQIRDDIVMPAVDAGSPLFPQPGAAARYMAGLIWDSVSRVVVAAVEAMSWLQKAAKLLAREVIDKETEEVAKPALPVYWITSDGFPVWQEYLESKKRRVDLMFMGQVRIQSVVVDTAPGPPKIDKKKQESGISPNFVHSQDGNHMRTTVVRSHDVYGVTFFSIIHDSFGTIPAHAGKVFRAVRETMVEMYADKDVLADFRDQFIDQIHESQLEDMPPVPAKGTLNIHEILKSEFAFA